LPKRQERKELRTQKKELKDKGNVKSEKKEKSESSKHPLYAPKTSAVYDESRIKTLSSLEHIRLRYGMYIGRLGDGSNHDDGIYVLLKEVIDNSVDEFVMGHGRRIDVHIKGDTVSIRDFGRGIPLGKVVDCVSKINTGAKYDSQVFKFSVGLNGVGSKAVNALSEHFIVRSIRDGKYREAVFKRGKLENDYTGDATEKNGTAITFKPDGEIFPVYAFQESFLEKRLWHYACLNSGLTLTYNGKTIKSERGLYDLLDAEIGESALYPLVHYQSERIEFSFTHTDAYGDTYYSFVNGQYTPDGGTHQSAFREGILKGINEFSGKSFTAIDVREGILGAVSIRIDDPIFESQTKSKLGNTDIRGWVVGEVKKHVEDFLHRNLDVAEAILRKIAMNEKIRVDLQVVKKEARELAKKTAIKIPKLKDCKIHLTDQKNGADKSMIFITEGQSAAGSMVSSRDVMSQAIYSLKGKPLNCHGEKLAKIYKNEELYNIMRALGVEESMDGLRYQKIVLATDADVDGLHIRNLILTFFLTYFEQLVVNGHVFILDTPIYRVRDGKRTLYCYSENEKNNALSELGRKAEITRFKGLGEISPGEFGQFIGKDMRLREVQIREIKQVPDVLDFYMGRNTPARREYIMRSMV